MRLQSFSRMCSSHVAPLAVPMNALRARAIHFLLEPVSPLASKSTVIALKTKRIAAPGGVALSYGMGRLIQSMPSAQPIASVKQKAATVVKSISDARWQLFTCRALMFVSGALTLIVGVNDCFPVMLFVAQCKRHQLFVFFFSFGTGNFFEDVCAFFGTGSATRNLVSKVWQQWQNSETFR